QFQEGNYSAGLVTGVQIFVSILGERWNFTFEAMDQQPRPTTAALRTAPSSPVVKEPEKLPPSKPSTRETTSRTAETVNQKHSEAPRPSPSSAGQVSAIASSATVAARPAALVPSAATTEKSGKVAASK